jgi:xylulokinase
VIRPSLIWCDQRSQAQVDAVNQTVGRENILKLSPPTPCSPASRCPSCCGCAITSRANFERVRTMLLPKDYVRFR